MPPRVSLRNICFTTTRYYVLVRVQQGSFSASHGNYAYRGTGVVRAATSQDPVNRQAALKENPELAGVANDETFALVLALRMAGF